MTTRTAALAGVGYFADVRDIAARVGVDVPSDTDIAARFAAADAIDIDALSADSSMLADVVGNVTGAADAAFDAHGAMPDAWRGRSAEAADAAVATHVRHAQDAVDRIRVVAGTVAAAVSALSRVQTEKHRTLATLRTDRVAGHAISTITTDDVDADAVAIARDIGAAVDMFTRTMDTVDAAISTILLALTDSFAVLPSPRDMAPEGYSSGALPTPATPLSRRRADIVAATPTHGLDRAVPGADSGVLVAAISATATITGAALAAASAVGIAAAGGLGAVVTHLIDAVADDHDVGVRDGVGGGTVGRDSPDVTRPSTSAPSAPTATAPTPTAPTPTAPTPTAPIPTAPAISENDPLRPPPQSQSSPPVPPSVVAPSVGATSDSGDDPVARSQGVDAHTVPPVGSRTRGGDTPPRGRPDPDDGGGLALAGDR